MSDTERFGWPDVMRTSLAAQYINGSKWTVLRAVEAGKLTPAGRCGRTFTFRKADLDRYLLGDPVPVASAVPAPAVTRASSDVLERLAAIKRGRGR